MVNVWGEREYVKLADAAYTPEAFGVNLFSVSVGQASEWKALFGRPFSLVVVGNRGPGAPFAIVEFEIYGPIDDGDPSGGGRRFRAAAACKI